MQHLYILKLASNHHPLLQGMGYVQNIVGVYLNRETPWPNGLWYIFPFPGDRVNGFGRVVQMGGPPRRSNPLEGSDNRPV